MNVLDHSFDVMIVKLGVIKRVYCNVSYHRRLCFTSEPGLAGFPSVFFLHLFQTLTSSMQTHRQTSTIAHLPTDLNHRPQPCTLTHGHQPQTSTMQTHPQTSTTDINHANSLTDINHRHQPQTSTMQTHPQTSTTDINHANSPTDI